MNVVFAFAIATAIYFVGLPIPVNPAIIGYVEPNSAEAKLGIQEGDRIVAVNGKPVKTWQDVNAEHDCGTHQRDAGNSSSITAKSRRISSRPRRTTGLASSSSISTRATIRKYWKSIREVRRKRPGSKRVTASFPLRAYPLPAAIN